MKKNIMIQNISNFKETPAINAKGVHSVEKVETNAIQLIFDQVPCEEVRGRLRYLFGFVWNKDERAWQRTLNDAGRNATNKFLNWYKSI